MSEPLAEGPLKTLLSNTNHTLLLRTSHALQDNPSHRPLLLFLN